MAPASSAGDLPALNGSFRRTRRAEDKSERTVKSYTEAVRLFADGDLMRLVIEHLQADGYRVTAPPFPMTRLAEDLARPRQVLARQGGPTVVAGHSDGGQIITALGTDPPNLVGLVYSAAFGLAEGASIGALLDQGPPGPAQAHLDRGGAGRNLSAHSTSSEIDSQAGCGWPVPSRLRSLMVDAEAHPAVARTASPGRRCRECETTLRSVVSP